MQRDVARRGAREDRVGPVVLVERLEDDHLVARVDDRRHRRHHRFGRAAADRDLLVGDHLDAVAAGERLRDRLAKRARAPRDRVLVDVGVDGGAGGLLDRSRRRKIGKALREVDAAVRFAQPRHLADDRLGELQRFPGTCDLRHRDVSGRPAPRAGRAGCSRLLLCAHRRLLLGCAHRRLLLHGRRSLRDWRPSHRLRRRRPPRRQRRIDVRRGLDDDPRRNLVVGGRPAAEPYRRR